MYLLRRHILNVPRKERKGTNFGCECHLVIIGKIKPKECPLFLKTCTPAKPVGACMVSSRGNMPRLGKKHHHKLTDGTGSPTGFATILLPPTNVCIATPLNCVVVSPIIWAYLPSDVCFRNCRISSGLKPSTDYDFALIPDFRTGLIQTFKQSVRLGVWALCLLELVCRLRFIVH